MNRFKKLVLRLKARTPKGFLKVARDHIAEVGLNKTGMAYQSADYRKRDTTPVCVLGSTWWVRDFVGADHSNADRAMLHLETLLEQKHMEGTVKYRYLSMWNDLEASQEDVLALMDEAIRTL